MTASIKPKRYSTPEAKEEYRRYSQARYKANCERMQELKKKPCMDCGNSFPPYVMDWDHRNPETKKYHVGRLAYSTKAWSTITEEIEKCDLVCANCHRIRTHGMKEVKE